MSDLNQCNFTGRLGQDPETRAMPNGDSVTNISLAVGWKSKDKEGVEWVRVVMFKRLADLASQYLHKGDQVRITGKFRTRQWEKEGQKHYSTEIIADEMQFLGGGKGDNQQSQPSEPVGNKNQAADDFNDDIPF